MHDRPGYGDAQARQILERATQIEREQGQRLDARALQEIGTEAGISPAAIERAIQEHESAPLAKVSWVNQHRAAIIAAVIAVVIILFYAMRRAP